MGSELKYRSLKGMPDILPEEMAERRVIEDKARDIFQRYGYGEICTPVMEETEVFTRSIGEDTDIVEKEMYSLTDRGRKNISLRPEGTASIIRAYIEHGLNNKTDLAKLFYIGPMFRGERPQKGRLRQFYQIGAEVIGRSNPYIDAEVIMSLKGLLEEFGVREFTILLNSLGCADDRKKYQAVLSEFLSAKEDSLCENCKRRTKKNVLRVLDCKVENCKNVLKNAPKVTDSLCGDCSDKYGTLKDILKDVGVSFEEKKDLVRGLDYYTGTVFEVTSPSLGAQDAIAAGGRYDGLTEQMGGPDAGAIGYAIGVERLMLAVDKEKREDPYLDGILIVPMDKKFMNEALKLSQGFKDNGFRSETDLLGKSFNAQMRNANKRRWKYVSVLGEDEASSRQVQVKDMETGEQKLFSFEDALVFLGENIDRK